ncbi:hypothetical protein [Desulfohalovibrio reitneri]|uniref:hypothetical protein n=1 Tax=Desulfohalovibrio reitneri TaxID=1307759 RepID=UPI00068E1199|nr:hypothetical protein [Desulfohalovibrio reitneri]
MFHQGPQAARSPLLIALAVAAIICSASPAAALQVHPAPEGLYVHQFGHFLFFLTSILLLFGLGLSALPKGRGRLYLRVSCLLFALWNAATFSAHLVHLYLDVAPFVGDNPWTMTISSELGNIALLYYFLSFDHLLAVPAMLFFVLGLRSFLKEVSA